MGSVIVGTGMSVPDRVVGNDDLAAVMDTSDRWIATRSGVRERRVAEPGVGASHLGAAAAAAALADAGLDAGAVDLLVTATMTPDFLAPGMAPLIQDRLGLGRVPSFDLRAQCSGFLYALDLADGYLQAERAGTALVVGAEVHSGFMPWSAQLASGAAPDPAGWDRNTRHRGWGVLFGDGAGAMVVKAGRDPAVGYLGGRLWTDGSLFELIHVPGVGFRHQPYVDQAQLEGEDHLPVMQGRELYRQAVRLMPEAVRQVLAEHGLGLEDLDVVVAHQANDRITEGVRRALGVDADVVPSNIGRYGNTTAATLPILYHELRSAGRVPPGGLVCFTAFGAGAHWGAALYREPGDRT